MLIFCNIQLYPALFAMFFASVYHKLFYCIKIKSWNSTVIAFRHSASDFSPRFGQCPISKFIFCDNSHTVPQIVAFPCGTNSDLSCNKSCWHSAYKNLQIAFYSNKIVIVGSSIVSRPLSISNPISTSFISETDLILLLSKDDSQSLISITALLPFLISWL